MASLQDVSLPKDTWVDITAAVSAAVGGALDVQNTGQIPVRIQESVAEPSSINDLGLVVTHLIQASSTPTALESVWGRAIGGNSNVNVQVV